MAVLLLLSRVNNNSRFASMALKLRLANARDLLISAATDSISRLCNNEDLPDSGSGGGDRVRHGVRRWFHH